MYDLTLLVNSVHSACVLHHIFISEDSSTLTRIAANNVDDILA